MERLENLFFAQGYGKIPSNLPEFNFYCHREVQGLNVLYVIDYRQGLYISEDQYVHMKDRIADFFRARGETELIHETQTADFYGWKGLLEEYLFGLIKAGQENADAGREPERKKDPQCWPWVSIFLVAVNVIVFLICTLMGDLL